ncbi:hypothetical protein BDV24DRAFT_173094 [Aspergillus arachidicola]|uniref:Short-chain dehydrogenase n=1 Tax=Aspergillus arachidicola TaxID=656916 RepID=A0A5N6YS06_9EURO|nr:hypothetical protein BDV24DRAFT_173094 [Aspergillus arachidicola]
MGAPFSQFFPPRPTFTLSDVPSQQGKVIVTGAASGIGQELVRMLYQKGATVYLAGRSETYPEAAIQLDLLVNNAGVSQPPLGSVSAQGIELQIATNCLGPFLLTQLLLPFLTAAVTDFSPAPRVIWTSSQVAELSAPPEGILLSELRNPPRDAVRNYVTSKLGNWFLSMEFARRHEESGLVSVAQNPGAANTNLLRDARWMKLLTWPLLHSPVLSAHTVLYAAFSEELGRPEHNCGYVIPWGRIHPGVAPGLARHLLREDEGGTGRAREFWE